jgi:predicted AAA+ superfamily ATPase
MLDKIFENYCPDDYNDVHMAFDKISGIYSDKKIHHLVGNQYLKQPESDLIELNVPRQTGKSTWIKNQFYNYPEETLVVYPTEAMRRVQFQGQFDFRKNPRIITTASIPNMVGRNYSKIELILLDEVCSYSQGRPESNTILRQILALLGKSNTRSVKCVSLYTERWP